uniref:Uncharacterized protein n=1 Tax=Euplotes crassus TaxID=5936 RepID=A0A7S3KG63_EUPCR|mmetsp:Transcript_258/g.243  ORF Transcript_258/g.243 Transcript_258/m.243 type:complete len:111 (+) Transcript_258:2564-2896(+)
MHNSSFEDTGKAKSQVEENNCLNSALLKEELQICQDNDAINSESFTKELKREVSAISQSIDKCINKFQLQKSLADKNEVSQLLMVLNMKMNSLQTAYFHLALSESPEKEV